MIFQRRIVEQKTNLVSRETSIFSRPRPRITSCDPWFRQIWIDSTLYTKEIHSKYIYWIEQFEFSLATFQCISPCSKHKRSGWRNWIFRNLPPSPSLPPLSFENVYAFIEYILSGPLYVPYYMEHYTFIKEFFYWNVRLHTILKVLIQSWSKQV